MHVLQQTDDNRAKNNIRARAARIRRAQSQPTPAVLIHQIFRRFQRRVCIFARHQFRRVHLPNQPGTLDDLLKRVHVVVLRKRVNHQTVEFTGRGFVITSHLSADLREHSRALFLAHRSRRRGALFHLRFNEIGVVDELRHEYRIGRGEGLIVFRVRREGEFLGFGAEIDGGGRGGFEFAFFDVGSSS